MLYGAVLSLRGRVPLLAPRHRGHRPLLEVRLHDGAPVRLDPPADGPDSGSGTARRTPRPFNYMEMLFNYTWISTNYNYI